jgi:AcrR family transcriptional regulator
MTTSRRSDGTRAAILNAARERFAADGYERATIRAIAADAGIDPSMVIRYYGSKEGLFAAAAEFDLHFPDLTAIARERLGRTLIEHFMVQWESGESLQLLLRAGATNPAAAQRLQQIFAEQLAPAIASLLPPRTADAEIAGRAAMTAGQMLGVALCRYVLRLGPMASMPAGELVGWLGPTLQRYLVGPAPDSGPGETT